MTIRNGIPAQALGDADWHKPWSDDVGGACLEVKLLPEGQVALRQSTDAGGPALILSNSEWTAFVEGVKAGKADRLL